MLMTGCTCIFENVPAQIIILCFVFQKTATAVAHCKRGNGLVKVNGRPLELIEPEMLRYKVHRCVKG